MIKNWDKNIEYIGINFLNTCSICEIYIGTLEVDFVIGPKVRQQMRFQIIYLNFVGLSNYL